MVIMWGRGLVRVYQLYHGYCVWGGGRGSSTSVSIESWLLCGGGSLVRVYQLYHGYYVMGGCLVQLYQLYHGCYVGEGGLVRVYKLYHGYSGTGRQAL